MESNVSTVAFRSNLYPVEKSFYKDTVFRSKIYAEGPAKKRQGTYVV